MRHLELRSQDSTESWLFQANKLTENQIAIIIIKDKNSTRLVMIFVHSFNFTQYSPFVQKGRLERIWQLFGDETDNILNELNESLAA